MWRGKPSLCVAGKAPLPRSDWGRQRRRRQQRWQNCATCCELCCSILGAACQATPTAADNEATPPQLPTAPTPHPPELYLWLYPFPYPLSPSPMLTHKGKSRSGVAPLVCVTHLWHNLLKTAPHTAALIHIYTNTHTIAYAHVAVWWGVGERGLTSF